MICSVSLITFALSAFAAVSAAPVPDQGTNAQRFARGLPPLPPSKTGHSLHARQSPNPLPPVVDTGFPAGFTFTSTYDVAASPNVIIDTMQNPAPGLAGASGRFRYGINSESNVICYNIELFGFPPAGELTYQSGAATATHIHEAVAGRSGPPRIAFPNPQYQEDGSLSSRGCLIGPFRTGLNAAGTTTDTGMGFTVAQIEANPSGFFTDTHTSQAVAGAVRGQLA